VQYRTLGRTGLKIGAVSLGGWLTYGNTVDAGATTPIVRRALDLGVNYLDTADVYAQGECESAFGRALEGVRRSSFVLGSKVFWPTGPGPNDQGLSRKHIHESCAASLKRLKTDYIDLYYCHRHDPDVPIDEVIRSMEDLVSQGKILYWGVSCWTSGQIREAIRLSRTHRPVVDQPPYNLFDRNVEKDILTTCAKEGVGVVVWSPLAQGVLTGKYLEGKPAGTRGSSEKVNKFMERYLRPEATATVKGFVALAKQAGLTPAQLALAWCLRRPEVTSTIVGATNVAQIEETAAAGPLPKEILPALERLTREAPLIDAI
jgi:aryl-alcohol dehydrogenase-like predicted oxidoreductase